MEPDGIAAWLQSYSEGVAEEYFISQVRGRFMGVVQVHVFINRFLGN